MRLLLQTPDWPIVLLASAAVILWLFSYCMPRRWPAFCTASRGPGQPCFSWRLHSFIVFRMVADRYLLRSGQKMNRRPWIIALVIFAVTLALECTRLPEQLFYGLSHRHRSRGQVAV